MAPKSAMDITVKIGTQFRKAIADGNPLWEVLSITGDHAEIVCVDEPFVHDGMTFPSDYAGTRSSALVSEIRQSLSASAFFEGLVKKSEDFWKNQEDGNVLHYHNSFGQFIRGVVVTVDGKKALRPTAMVGAWGAFDAARRMPNGSIQLGYHARKIMEGTPFAPHESNVFESPSFTRNPKHGDPRTMEPISLALPEPTVQEKVRQMQEGVIESVVASLQDTSVSVEDRLAAAIDALRDAQ